MIQNRRYRRYGESMWNRTNTNRPLGQTMERLRGYRGESGQPQQTFGGPFGSCRASHVACANGLKVALNTFDLSYSTWGLDLLWPRLFNFEPVVVDEFVVTHTKPVGGAGNAF